MFFIRKMIKFGASQAEMVHLWETYCRSVLEQSAVLWQGALTQENRDNLERTQKSFVKLLLRGKYKTYEQALEQLNMKTLNKRRDILCLSFAKKCTLNSKTSHIFPQKKRNQMIMKLENKRSLWFTMQTQNE